MVLAPIALFVYNRPLHTQKTVEALQRNALAAESNLIIFADGAKAQDRGVDSVRRYIRSIQGFRSITVHEREKNMGLARSIINGVTQVCSEHGRVIVMEDDLVTSPWFLKYMNDALELYESNHKVASIHGYCYPLKDALPETFFLRGGDCWGWATWDRAWAYFDSNGTRLLRSLDKQLQRAFDLGGAYPYTQMLRDQVAGINNSWAIRWHASCFIRNKLTLYPGRSLVENIGHDASGTHCRQTSFYSTILASKPVRVEPIPVEESEEGRLAFAQFLRRAGKGRFGRLIQILRRRLGSTVWTRA